MEKYSFNILGQKINLATDDGTKTDFIKIVDYYRHIIDKLQKNYPDRTTMELAVLAGIQVTEEFYRYIKNEKSKSSNITFDDERINELLSEAIKQLDISLKL